MAAYIDLTNEELEKLPTHRLYEVYKRYRKSDLTDVTDDWCEGNDRTDVTKRTHDKCVFIKSVLDGRGHLPHKHENHEPKKTKHLGGECRWVEQVVENRKTNQYHSPGLTIAGEQAGSIKVPEDVIGLQVYKKSKKPFKSKNLYNTVKSVTKNPHTGRVAFDFKEDGSIVDAHLCHLRKQKKG